MNIRNQAMDDLLKTNSITFTSGVKDFQTSFQKRQCSLDHVINNIFVKIKNFE